MIKNYLKIIYRNLIKHKFYSFINIFGLSLGIACCILILAYIGYELSYDSYHKNADNIYRIASTRTFTGRTMELATSPGPIAPTMINDFPEVINAVRFMPTVKRAFNYKDNNFFQTGVIYADRSVFEVFSFNLIKGDPKTALEVPYTMVITEKTAQKYFGDEDPLGKIIRWDRSADYTVTGIVETPPANSHFRFTVLVSFSTLIRYDPRIGNSWSSISFQTYLLLRDKTDAKEFETKLAAFNEKYLEQIMKEQGGKISSYLQPLKSIHLHSRLMGELGANSDIRIIYAFSGIGLLILLIACINFMNLSTARSARREKEVGLRKVLGAKRTKLIFQFLGESFIFSVLSLVLAVFLARLLLPYFIKLSGRDVALDILQLPYMFAGLLGILLFVGLIAGSYPAFFMSSFKPISALRGNISIRSKKSWFRSILVVFQFMISSVLIIGTLIIFNQQKYMQTKDLGFNKDNLLVIALQNKEARTGLDSFKQELIKINGVKNVCATSMVPGEIYLFTTGTYPEGFSREQRVVMENFLVDHDFLETFEVNVLQGRGFSQEILSDITEAVLINETAAKKLEWKNPLGKKIDINPADSFDTQEMAEKRVIGVFKDIHQRSLYSVVQPTFIQYYSDQGGIENRARRLTLRLETEDLAGTLAKIEQVWKTRHPDNPYYAFFLDEFYESQHRAEAKLGGLFRSFSTLAILIGCVGLFGLASYMAEKRTKEIGIRKVLGSSVNSIVRLLCKEFLILILIANFLAWPLAFLAAKKWLQNFPYSVNIKLSTFVLTMLITLVVTLCTMGFQSIKAALANPVESLRYE